jgi:hypothetical protein
MGFDEAKTNEYIEKLKKQMDTPKEYSILVMFDNKDGAMMKEALNNAGINYKYHGDTYYSIDGNQDILAKIREIAPPSAKIYPYAKKMESVLKDVERPPQEKKPSKNTAAVKAANKKKKKELHRCTHKKGKGKSVAKQQRKISLSERKKLRKATVVQLNAKKGSTAPQKASTSIKKAA